jgi:hypothetical protein
MPSIKTDAPANVREGEQPIAKLNAYFNASA